MGYFATGGGHVTFDHDSDPDRDTIAEALDYAFGPVEFYPQDPHEDAHVYVSYEGKYFEDDVREALDKLREAADISDGCVEFCGEDGAHWRFLYRPADGWVEQEGRIVYYEV